MSSTEEETSPSNFQLIVGALADYAEQTGVDLSKSSFAEKLERSNTPHSILEMLQERENAFKEYRDRNRRLIRCITPAVEVLHAFSAVLGEAVSLVSRVRHVSIFYSDTRQVLFPPAKAIFAGIDALIVVCPLKTCFNQFPGDV